MDEANTALKYLQEGEWTMGNGQCGECCGNKPRARWHTDTVGHRQGCKKAKAIEALGGKVVWERFNHSKYRRATRRFFRKMCEEINKEAK